MKNSCLIVIFVCLLFVSMFGCGGAVPYETCNNVTEQACFDEDGDNIPEVVVICDGSNWIPVMICNEQFNIDGYLLQSSCMIYEKNAICVQK